MSAYALETRAARPALGRNLRTLLTRLARTVDDLVSARAAREVPEWRMREVQAEIDRHRGFIETAARRRSKAN